ncbi:MAG: AAA family ATPase [Thermoplasmata archaeon]
MSEPGHDEWKQGNKHMEQGAYEKAIASYTAALAKNPTYGDARFNRGLAYYLVHRYMHALEDLHWAMELEPKRADIRLLLGKVRVELGENALAIQNYREALALDPNLTDARVAIAVLEDRGISEETDETDFVPSPRLGSNASPGRPRAPEAPRELPTAAEIVRPQQDETLIGAIERTLHSIPDDEDPRRLTRRAILLSALHRREAADAWERIFRHSGRGDDLLAAIRTRFEFGEWEEVLRLSASAPDPDSQDLVRMEAHALLATGRPEDARRRLEGVADPTAETQRVLVGTLLALGDAPAALAAVTRLGSMAPADPRTATLRRIVDRSWFGSSRPLDTLVGLDSVKARVRERVVLPTLVPEIFLSRIPTNKFLMMGPPGCGKTSVARLAAREAHAQLRLLHLSSVLNLYTGNSEANLTAVFTEAKDAARETPVVLFIDEVDSIGVTRERMVQYGEHRLINHFMNELDQIAFYPGLMILAATNVPFDLDPAVLRSGRLGTPIYVGPPSADARRQLLERERQRFPSATFDAGRLASDLRWYSPADIDLVFTNLAYAQAARALEGTNAPVGEPEIRAAFRAVIPSVRKWFQRLTDTLERDPAFDALMTEDLRRDLEEYRQSLRQAGSDPTRRSSMFG